MNLFTENPLCLVVKPTKLLLNSRRGKLFFFLQISDLFSLNSSDYELLIKETGVLLDKQLDASDSLKLQELGPLNSYLQLLQSKNHFSFRMILLASY